MSTSRFGRRRAITSYVPRDGSLNLTAIPESCPQRTQEDEDDVLPDMQEGETLKLLKLDPSQHFTKPLPRYSRSQSGQELEKRGIGRPSTYASIISTIQDRGYVTAG